MSPDLKQLESLAGEWTSSSKKYPDARGRMTVTRSEDGKFLRIDARLDDPRFPRSTQLVGADESRDEWTALYYDSRGVYRVYAMTLDGGEWRVWREAPRFNQRYTGRISQDGNMISGRWEVSEDGESWRVDFDLNYEKVG